MRRLAVILLVVLGSVACLAVAAVVYIDHAELSGFAKSRVEGLVGRPVRMASLRVSLGRIVHVSIRELRLPSAADPSLPDFARARTAEADIELLPLLRGALVVPSLAIDGLAVTVQRNKDGVGNWAKAGAAPRPPNAPPGPPSSLPALLDIALRDAEIDTIGSSGKPFRVHLDRAAIRTTSPDAPVDLDTDGALQGVPVTLKGTLGSYRALQDRPKPFPMKLLLTSNHSTLTYDGTATDPLGFDGLDGAAALAVPQVTELLHSMGSPIQADLPFTLAGALTRSDNEWFVRDGRGKLDDSAFTGDIHYIEGGRGQPDSIAPTLSFTALDVGRIRAKIHTPPSPGPADALPEVSLNPDPRVNATLSAKLVTDGPIRATDAAAHILIQPGEMVLDETRFGFGGGKASLALDAKPSGSGTHVTGTVSVEAVNLRQAFVAAGSKAPPVNGPLSGQVLLDINGRALKDAAGRGRVTAALALAGGTIGQNLVRQVALDVRALFGSEAAATRLDCALVVVDIRNGAGAVGPVRLVTPEGAIDGWGELDVARDTVDMTLQSDRTTSGPLALDIPIRVTGSLSSPSIAPSLEASRRRFGPARLGPWPAEIVKFMRTSACLKTR